MSVVATNSGKAPNLHQSIVAEQTQGDVLENTFKSVGNGWSDSPVDVGQLPDGARDLLASVFIRSRFTGYHLSESAHDNMIRQDTVCGGVIFVRVGIRTVERVVDRIDPV